MASRKTIAAAHAFLVAAGIRLPKGVDVRANLAVWLDVFADVPDQTLQAAARTFVQSPSGWWPTPGELLASVRPDCSAAAARAHGELLALASRWGRAKPPRPLDCDDEARWRLSEDPATEAAMWAGVRALGGWRRVCVGEMGFGRPAAFKAAFVEALKTEEAQCGLRLATHGRLALPGGK